MTAEHAHPTGRVRWALPEVGNGYVRGSVDRPKAWQLISPPRR